MSERSSEKTPDSGGVKALEDIRPEHGALTVPSGPPVTLGPEVNPFWSESAKEEAILRACRPSHLPKELPDSFAPAQTSVSPPREVPDAVRAMVQGLVQENARLWSEREAYSYGQGGWGHPPGGSYGPQPWYGGMPSQRQERSPIEVMMDMMKSSLGAAAPSRDRGLLGPLALPSDQGGSFLPTRQDGGGFGGQSSMPRGSLMELFNLVSSAGGMFGSQSMGASEARQFSGEGVTGSSSQGSGRVSGERVQGGAEIPGAGMGGNPQGRSGVPVGDPVSQEAGAPGDQGEGVSARGGAGQELGEASRQGDGGQGQSNSGVPGGGLPDGGGFPGGSAPTNGFGGYPGGFPGGNGFPGGGPGGGGFPGGGPGGGGFPGGGPGHGGFPGGPPGGGAANPFGNVPAWLGGLMAQQESVRAVELPSLQELSESEVGPLLAGDWITTIGPFLRDMSSSSSVWWDEVLRVAGALYRVWLGSEPMERLRLAPVTPPAFQAPPWLRIEQRGSVALLKAVPESLRSELVAQREVSSIGIMFKVLRVYQPGGLGERTTLLKQLVDQKVPSHLTEWMVALRAWRRWLTRVQELDIQPPDPVLLLSTLDRFAAALAKHSPQVAFRLQVTRAALRVDTAPTEQSIQHFSESLLAEGEAVFHGGSWLPIKDTVKVKALDGDGPGARDDGQKKDGKDKVKEPIDSKDGRDGKDKSGKPDLKPGKGDSKGASAEKPVCRYFLSESGCKKGQKCTFPHEWKGISKQGRCWNCGSSQHMKSECPVKEAPRVKKESLDEKKGKEIESKPVDVGAGPTSSQGMFMPPADGEQPAAEALVKEAVQLLKSLRPSLRAVTVCAVNKGKGYVRALLDGGATHILRPAKSQAEFEAAVPIQVELAAGVATLRQVQSSGTLVTDFDTQMIVPLGKVVKLGYRVVWEGEEFEMVDPKGVKMEVQLDAGCPTVDLELAKRLIQELEDQEEELGNRVRALRAGNPGDLSPNIWRWLKDLREMWPEVPDELLARVVPSGRWSADQVPLNRHQRRRILSSPSVIVHLFSGPDQSWWRKRLESSARTVVCIDKMVDSAQDLLSDQLASFLAELCEKGTVDAVLGGPPCRTVSKLRFKQPGPPPLRSRSGPERFALQDLPDALRELAWNDAVLWMRQLWLFSLAAKARKKPVLFLKEQPRDPQEYKEENDPIQYPSFFAWPEWKIFIERFGIKEVRLDLGALGHPRRKPTTLGTNIRHVHHLDGMSDHRKQRDGQATPSNLQDRMSMSRSWAAWPLDFKTKIVKGILLELEGYQSMDEGDEGSPLLAKMTAEQWRQHVLNDHMPYSRECSTCLQGGGRSRPHRKVQRPDAQTLSVDICGPFRPGHDRRAKAKYFMVGVFSIPVKRIEGKISALPLSIEETMGAKDDGEVPDGEELLPALEEEKLEEGEKKEEDVKRLEEWERLEVEAEQIEIQNYTMVETLASRNAADVKACLARMIARLKYLGMDVRRVHSDAAGEMRSTRRWCEERGLYRTFTCGSDWKANGRAEAEIGVIRRAINTLIRSSGDGEDYWPLMAKHVGERRGRQQLALLGFDTPKLLPWGQKVMVTTKGWDDFQGHWRSRKKPGIVRGPDPDMSLTSGGHLVEVERGNFVRTDDMVMPGEPPAVEDVLEVKIREEPAHILDKSAKPKRRLTEKTALACIGVDELQRRLGRGQMWANEEFMRLESNVMEEKDISVVGELDSENRFLEEVLSQSEVMVRKAEVSALNLENEEEEIFLQTRTISLNEVRRSVSQTHFTSLGSAVEGGDPELRFEPGHSKSHGEGGE